jgi:excisionase family DNA binding protein
MRQEQIMPDEQLMSIRDVADFLKLNQTTIYAWAQQGILPGYKLGRTWRFRPSDIEAWLEERRNAEASKAVTEQTAGD